MPDGSERSITYASCTLTASKRNYAQVEKEALSLIFSIKKFHQFLWETFHSYHGPQAAHYHTGAKERCSHAVLGIVTVHLQLRHQISTYSIA